MDKQSYDETAYYVAHFTTPYPSAKPSYETSGEISGPHALERAIRTAYVHMREGRQSFVTARNKDGAILSVLPVVDYPVAQEVSVREDAEDAISRLFNDMDWTI